MFDSMQNRFHALKTGTGTQDNKLALAAIFLRNLPTACIEHGSIGRSDRMGVLMGAIETDANVCIELMSHYRCHLALPPCHPAYQLCQGTSVEPLPITAAYANFSVNRERQAAKL